MMRYRLLFAKPGLHRKMAKLIHNWFQWLWKYHYFIFYRTFTATKVKLLFFFSFVLASAALVQHGAKLPLSNVIIRLRVQFGIYLHECFLQKVSKLHELAIFPLANFKVSNRRFLHLIIVLHSLRYLHFVSLFLHYQFPRFCTLSADQIQEICPCILLESKLWVWGVLFL